MKITIYNVLSLVLFPIAFVSLFFVIGGSDHGATCWIGFGFILFSYLMMTLIPLLAPKTKSAHIFGTTSATLNAIYFGINFALGLLFMIKDFEEWKYPLLAEIVLFVIFLVFLLQVLKTDEVTAAKEIKHEAEVSAVKEMVSKAKMIMDSTNDMEIKRSVQMVYNELNTCPTNSNANVRDIDQAISYNLSNLNVAVMSNDLKATQDSAASTILLIKKRKENSRV